MRPSFAAAASVRRQWFDWTAPHVISVSAPFAERIGDEELELARLVAAAREAQQVVALDVEIGAAEQRRKPLHLLERRPALGVAAARKSCEVHDVDGSCVNDPAGETPERYSVPRGV